MATTRIKTIQTDIFDRLQKPANDFLSTTPGLVVEKIVCDDYIVTEDGNQAHNFTCQYRISGVGLAAQRVRLIMRDSPIALQQAMNAAIEDLADDDNEITDIQRCDTTLANGNKFYGCCLVYEDSETPSVGLQVKIIEMDNIISLQSAVNTFLATAITVNSIGVLRQENVLDNGNRIYTCTIPYTPEA